MKRTSLWVPLAAAGVQLAALALCAWATQRGRGQPALGRSRPRDVLPTVEPVTLQVSVAPEPPVRAAAQAGVAPPAAATPAERSPAAPGRAIPRFISNFADESTAIAAADEGPGEIVFGIFSDGNIRCVDVDNGCYAGKAEGSRARMREVAGSRAFTVQLEPLPGDRFEAGFIGGLHDGRSIQLEPRSAPAAS